MKAIKRLLRQCFAFGSAVRNMIFRPGLRPSHIREYHARIAAGKCYFGRVMWAGQGSAARHAYMQALLKKEFSKERRPYEILEIGSWAGCSAVTWADAIARFNDRKGRVFCVDPWLPYECRVEDAPESTERVCKIMREALRTGDIMGLFLHNVRASGYEDLITVIRASSDDAFVNLKPNRFDVVFVDGSHYYTQVKKDIENFMSLVKDGGILCGDDLELQASSVDPQFLRSKAEQEYVQDPETGVYFHPGVTLAVGEHFGDVSVLAGFWFLRKNGQGWERIDAFRPAKHDLTLPPHLLDFCDHVNHPEKASFK